MANVRGGDKLAAALDAIAEKVKSAALVRVGFLENATYPDGTPVAMIAAIQEFGAPARNIPPRPYFRNMIADKKGEWPGAIAELLKDNDYDVAVTLGLTGDQIKSQLQESMKQTGPGNAPSTIAKKGFDAPLRDSGDMFDSVDYEVK